MHYIIFSHPMLHIKYLVLGNPVLMTIYNRATKKDQHLPKEKESFYRHLIIGQALAVSCLFHTYYCVSMLFHVNQIVWQTIRWHLSTFTTLLKILDRTTQCYYIQPLVYTVAKRKCADKQQLTNLGQLQVKSLEEINPN